VRNTEVNVEGENTSEHFFYNLTSINSDFKKVQGGVFSYLTQNSEVSELKTLPLNVAKDLI